MQNRILAMFLAILGVSAALAAAQSTAKPSKSAVWVSYTVTGGIAGGSQRIVVQENGEMFELRTGPGSQNAKPSKPLGKLDDAGRKALTEMLAELPTYIAPKKDAGHVSDGQTFEIRVNDEPKAQWYTATPDTPERVKKLTTWMTALGEKEEKK